MKGKPVRALLHHLHALASHAVETTVAPVVREHIRDHEHSLHTSEPPPAPLCPFRQADPSIPETTLLKMISMLEAIETEDFAITLIANVFGYPETTVLRELAAHRDRHSANQRKASF